MSLVAEPSLVLGIGVTDRQVLRQRGIVVGQMLPVSGVSQAAAPGTRVSGCVDARFKCSQPIPLQAISFGLIPSMAKYACTRHVTVCRLR